MTPKYYPSKISYAIWIPIMALITGLMIVSIIDGNIGGIVILALSGGFLMIPILFNTNYQIKEQKLNVRSGLIINIDIDIQTIKKVTKTRSMINAPALSMDRIEIFYNKYDSVVISPDNREDFLETLKQMNPAIVIEA